MKAITTPVATLRLQLGKLLIQDDIELFELAEQQFEIVANQTDNLEARYDALLQLGILYDHGALGEFSAAAYDRAAEHYTPVADQDLFPVLKAQASVALGALLTSGDAGRGTPEEISRGMRYFHNAIEQDDHPRSKTQAKAILKYQFRMPKSHN